MADAMPSTFDVGGREGPSRRGRGAAGRRADAGGRRGDRGQGLHLGGGARRRQAVFVEARRDGPCRRPHRLRRGTLHDQSGAGRAGARLARAPRAYRGTRPGGGGEQRLRERLHRRGRHGECAPHGGRRRRRPRLPAAGGAGGVDGRHRRGPADRQGVGRHPRGRLRTRTRPGQRHGAGDHDDGSVPEGARGQRADRAAGRSPWAARPRARE